MRDYFKIWYIPGQKRSILILHAQLLQLVSHARKEFVQKSEERIPWDSVKNGEHAAAYYTL